MKNSDYEVHFLFSFILGNINFSLNIRDVEKINKQINEKGIIGLEVQCGEHWEDISVGRRFLWLFFPHIHFKYSPKNDDTLQQLFEKVKITTTKMKISTVFGGVSLADLRMDITGDFHEIVNETDLLTGKRIGINEKHKPIRFEEAIELNNWFVTEIDQYKKNLNGVDCLKFNKEEIKWNEYAQGEQFDYFAGITKNGYSTFSLDKNIFYQDPYVILITEYEVGEDELNHFFGFRIEGKEPLLNRTEIKIPEKVSIWADPVKMLIVLKDKEIREEILYVIHRVLFLLRTKAHFCMLWDSKIQRLYKELHEILRGIGAGEPDYIEKLKKITQLSLILAEWSGEIFSSFIWRYSAFLSSAKGYLTETYRELDAVMTTHLKSEDLRNSVNEVRNQLEFVGNILRDLAATKYAEKFKEDQK